MVVYEKKCFTKQNFDVCVRHVYEKYCKVFLFIQNVTLSKLDTLFWTTLKKLYKIIFYRHDLLAVKSNSITQTDKKNILLIFAKFNYK